MADTKKMLELRKKIKQRRPSFVRETGSHAARLTTSWRKPRGLHSKMRMRKAGQRALVTPGFGSPAIARGLHPNGLQPIIIHRPVDLNHLSANEHGAVIASTVGQRKRAMIVRAAQSANITLLNIKDPAAFLEAAEQRLKMRKAKKMKKKTTKETKPEPAPKKEVKGSKEEKKDSDKKELDKILTKRN